SHPLDPLSKDEIATAVSVLNSTGKVTSATRLPVIVLNEPPKQEVLNYKPGAPIRREAFVVAYERASNSTAEAIVDLNAKKLLSWKPVPGVEPSFMLEDYLLMQEIVRGDPGWQAAIRKRGITDLENIQIDPWAAGQFGFPEEQGKRIFRAVSLYKGKNSNAYA